MNIHATELPPLPEWSKMDNLAGLVPSEIRQCMAEYARAAIEADRKQHDRMLAHEWIRPALGLSEDAPYRFDFYAQQIEGMKADRKHKGEVVVTKTPEGEIIAVTRQDDEGRILSVIAEAESKRRGEPVLVGWAVGTTGGGLLHASKYTEYEARRAGYSLPLYRLTATQPAVQSDAEVVETCRAMGANSFAEFFGKTAPQPDEPVKVPSDEQIDKAMSKVSMPFFPDKTGGETDRMIQRFVKELWSICYGSTTGNGAESGMNTGPQSGAHSASSYSVCGCNSDDCRVNGCLSKRQAQSAMATSGGGMPTEPVKVPSDDATDAARWRKARTLPRSWWRDAFNRVSTPEELEALIDTHGERRLP